MHSLSPTLIDEQASENINQSSDEAGQRRWFWTRPVRPPPNRLIVGALFRSSRSSSSSVLISSFMLLKHLDFPSGGSRKDYLKKREKLRQAEEWVCHHQPITVQILTLTPPSSLWKTTTERNFKSSQNAHFQGQTFILGIY